MFGKTKEAHIFSNPTIPYQIQEGLPQIFRLRQHRFFLLLTVFDLNINRLILPNKEQNDNNDLHFREICVIVINKIRQTLVFFVQRIIHFCC